MFFGYYNAQTRIPMGVKDIWGNDEVRIDCSYPLVNEQCVRFDRDGFRREANYFFYC